MSANRFLILLSFIAFVSLGMPDGLLGVAWPGIRQDFHLPQDAMGLLLIFGTAGYSLASFYTTSLVSRLGLGGLLGGSCALTAAVLFIYTATPSWVLFVAAAALGGIGAGAIDSGINSYIARSRSEKAMQWLHGSFGIGVTIGPVIMTFGLSLTGQWRPGYLIVSAAQLTLALLFLSTRGQWKAERTDRPDAAPLPTVTQAESLKYRGIQLGMLMFLLYVGIEIGLGLWAYTLLTESRGIAPQVAGLVTGGYWGSFTLGRFLAGWLTTRIPATRLLSNSIMMAMLGVLAVILDIHDYLTLTGIALTGFAIAPVFPGLMSDTERRTGPHHMENGIGMQIASAGLGAAVLPSLAGILARGFGLEAIPVYLFFLLTMLFLCFRISLSPRLGISRS